MTNCPNLLLCTPLCAIVPAIQPKQVNKLDSYVDLMATLRCLPKLPNVCCCFHLHVLGIIDRGEGGKLSRVRGRERLSHVTNQGGRAKHWINYKRREMQVIFHFVIVECKFELG
jgi:hypothetical protein